METFKSALPRSRAVPETTQVEVPLADGVEAALRSLVALYPGLYGDTVAEASAYLIRRGVDDLVRAGVLPERPAVTVDPDAAEVGRDISIALAKR